LFRGETKITCVLGGIKKNKGTYCSKKRKVVP
jgi:hypothetical protein